LIHGTAQVHATARIAESAKIWNWVQVRENAEIGENTIISKSVYVDFGVKIGRNVKIQNNVSVYHGVTIEDGVFVGPHVCFTNDKIPRAINADGTPKNASDWEVSPITVRHGASLGANCTVLPGVTVGRFAMVGAGAVVTKSVPDYGLVVGNPARVIGRVCECGRRVRETASRGVYRCEACRKDLQIQE
jgi:UDP-2-acetamido-3-amino-2,3-dideoxy-glucuronate N-acetyltransferase